jgi:hypothetical protein
LSLITGVIVFVCNYIYYFIAMIITHFENHRTVDLYRKNLSIKVAIFQFVNNFSTFYYLSFVAPFMSTSISNKTAFMSKCGESSCPSIIFINLVMVYSVQIVLKNFFFYFLPYFFTVISKLITAINSDDFNITDYFCGICVPSKYNSVNGDQSSSNKSKNENNSRTFIDSLKNCFGKRKQDGDEMNIYDIYAKKDDVEVGGINSINSISNATSTKTESSRIQTSIDSAVMPELDYHRKSWNMEYSHIFFGSNNKFLCNSPSIAELCFLYSEIAVSLGYLLLFNAVLPGVVVLFWIDLFLMQKRLVYKMYIYIYIYSIFNSNSK